jgi:U3 small nucleolar RNA-associated protein 22
MVPQISKRRKLDLDADMFQASDYSENDISISAPPNASSPATTPVQKGAARGMKRNREQSASAPYAGESYRSSLFKLQVDEMLAEVTPDYAKRLGPVDSSLRKLKSLIEAIPEREPLPVS